MAFYSDGEPSSARPRTADGSNMAKGKIATTPRNVTFTSGPRPGESTPREGAQSPVAESISREPKQTWRKVSLQDSNVDPDIMPGATPRILSIDTPFLVFNDAFTQDIGRNPRLDLIIADNRAPYFHGGGIYMPRLSTLFLTSGLLQDDDPGAVSSGNCRTELTKIEFFSSYNFSRDKIRSQGHSYMAAGVAEYPSRESPGLVICAQGSLAEQSGLVYVDTKRPHKTRMLLNNYQGRPFNSPCDVVANPLDGSLYFTDPAYGYERGFRPKPQLPTGHIYRFVPETGECRVVANGHSRTAGLAFSPDYTILYVSELGDRYGGTTIYAYTIATAEAYQPPQPNHHYSSIPHPQLNGGAHLKSTPSNPINSSHPSSLGSIATLNPGSTTVQHSYNRTVPIPLSPRLRTQASLSQLNPASRTHTHTRGLSDPVTKSSPSPSPVSFHSSVGGGPFLINKRLFAYTPSGTPSALISTNPLTGNVYLGTDEGVEVFSCGSSIIFPTSLTSPTNGNIPSSSPSPPPGPGTLIGKILVSPDEGLPITPELSPSHSQAHSRSHVNGHKRSFSQPQTNAEDDRAQKRQQEKDRKKKQKLYQRGISKVAFGLGGEFWLLGGERVWRGKLDLSPAATVAATAVAASTIADATGL